MTVKEALKLHPDMSREEAKAFAKRETGKRLADKYGWGKRSKRTGGDAPGESAPKEEAAPKEEPGPTGVMLPDIEDEIKRAPKVGAPKLKAGPKPKADAPTMRDDVDPRRPDDPEGDGESGLKAESGMNLNVLAVGMAAIGAVLLLKGGGGRPAPAQAPNAVPTDPLEAMIHNA